MKKIIILCLSALLLFTVFTGCNSKQEDDNSKLNIVATIFPEYDFARAIAGDKASVSMLTSPGASVHSFDPSPADITKVQKADIFIYIGGESDVWVDNILDSLDTSKMKVIRMMDNVKTVEEELKEGMQEEEEEHDNGEETEEPEYDEHIWTAPKNAIKLIDTLKDAMCEIDHTNAEIYKTNALNYSNELKKVDKDITDVVSAAKRKKIVVADKFPFRYFVEDYGLDYAAAFPGCSDQADAGVKTMTNLVDTVKNEKIPYVYYVELSNKSVAEAVAEQTGCGMLLLNSCHNVTKADFDKGVTYLSLMQQNVENLRKGLN